MLRKIEKSIFLSKPIIGIVTRLENNMHKINKSLIDNITKCGGLCLGIINEERYSCEFLDRDKLIIDNILKICDLFDKYKISYYCFLKNEDNWGYGNKNQTSEEKQKEFESLDLKSEIVLSLFNNDLEGEKNSKNLLLVLPAGKAAHIESGIAYGLGKKCYAIGEYDATDTLYNIFETIFNSETELEEFLKKYSY